MLLTKNAGGNTHRRSVTLLMLFLSASACAALSVPARAGWQGSPEGIALESVGEEMRMNGVPMTVRHFESDFPGSAVLAAFQRNWSLEPGAAPVKQSTLGEWRVLNQDIGDRHRSVQIKETAPGHIEGLVALTSPALRREAVPAVRLPAALSTVSVVDSIDAGRTAQQVMAVSSESMENTGNAIEAELRASGWAVQQRRRSATAMMLSANRGDQQFDAVLDARRGGTTAILNTVGVARP